MDISALRERSSPSAMTVAELNEFIKNIFDSNRALSSVTVKGEISNFTLHRSGHLYFSLKDSDSQIRAVMFRSSAARLKFIPENGMKVIAHGSVSVYSRDGSYQFYANSLQPDGVGALYLAYEQLKAKLEAEGLFSIETKRKIPEFPERIGVITSPTGAAVRDIINVTGRRYPLAKIYVYPSLVQGDGAERNLIKALDYFNKTKLVDTIIIGRGGGSIEDLWAFNSERLARKIYEIDIPVISAVGHETDFTICDFVADLRAPTPSAAAELAVPDIRELIMTISASEERIALALLRLLERRKEAFNKLYERFIKNSTEISTLRREKLKEALEKLNKALTEDFKDKSAVVRLYAEKLNAMSPLSVLARGYAIPETEIGVVRSVDEIKCGDTLNLRLKDGTLKAKIEEIKRGF